MRPKAIPLIAASLFCAAAHAQTPPPYSAASTYQAGNWVVGSDKNVYRAIAATVGHDPTKDANVYWELHEALSLTSLAVGFGQRFATFTSAWNFIQNAKITNGAQVQIDISSGNGAHPFVESFPSQLYLNHTYGNEITIAGDNVKYVQFRFVNQHGITISNGHAIGDFRNIAIDGNSATSGYVAVQVSGGSSLTAENIVVIGFGYGIDVSQHSTCSCQSSVIADVSNFGAALQDSYLDVTGITGSGGGTSFGFLATGNSKIEAQGAQLSQLASFAFWAGDGSYVDAANSTLTSCQEGCKADDHGTINARYSKVTKCGMGFEVGYSGYINATGATLSGNTLNYDYENLGSQPNTADFLNTDGSYIRTH